MRTSASPSIDRSNSSWTSAGRDVERPFTYNSLVSWPSGSRNIWCRSAAGNLTILSSTDGQYLGPFESIAPPYIADFEILSAMICLPDGPRYVIQHGSCSGCRVEVSVRLGDSQKCDHE